jgi:hypothetical protein
MDHDTITALCKEVGKFYKKELSLGNCAVFAMALHKFLGSDSSDHFEAVVIDAEENGEDKEFIEHVVLSHGGQCYDSYGECNLDNVIEDLIEDYTSDNISVNEANVYEYPISSYGRLVKGTASWTKLSDMVRSFQRAARRVTTMGEGMKGFKEYYEKIIIKEGNKSVNTIRGINPTPCYAGEFVGDSKSHKSLGLGHFEIIKWRFDTPSVKIIDGGREIVYQNVDNMSAAWAKVMAQKAKYEKEYDHVHIESF